MTFKQAVLSRDARAIGVYVARLRLHGMTYHQLFTKAQQHDPSLDLATWDALLAEADEHDDE